MPAPLDAPAIKAGLYRAAHAPRHASELALAAAAWFEGIDREDPECGPAAPDAWLDFLDFFVLEWVDARGFTALERELGSPLEPELLRWLLEVRSGVFAVSCWEGGYAEVRAPDGETLYVRVDEPLAPRSVILGRLLPRADGSWLPSGAPDVYEPMRVIQRLELERRWGEGPRRALVERTAALRRAFIQQREQRAIFIDHFGEDCLIFDEPGELVRALEGFLQHLEYEAALPSLGGKTRAQVLRERGEQPFAIRIEAGPSLAGSRRVGVLYDAIEGVHLLPAYGDFLDHLRGEGEHPQVVRAYLEDPGISALPFRRAGGSARLAALLGLPEAPLEELLAPYKDLDARAAPSLLAGLEG